MKQKHSPPRLRYQTQLYLKRNSSTILTCIGAAGVVATAVSAAMATPKAMQKLSSAQRKKRRQLSKAEAIVIAGPSYIPSIAIGASTIACIFSADRLNRRHQAALSSAYALLNESYKDYRSKLIELHGEDTDEEIRNAIVRECCTYHQIGVDTPDSKLIFVDPISKRILECYEREVMDAEYHINRNFVLRGYASLNEFYEFLGLPKTDYGDTVGWSMTYGYDWIDFEHRLVSENDNDYYDGRPVYEICYIFEPDTDYMREWE